LPGIEEGLTWVLDNYKAEGIQSLAMPALGCGLGKLEWKDVGPMMCRYLAQMDIPVSIYLPRESQLNEALLTAGYLLAKKPG
jgi:O-acetyl-ADP-ribose deacetylase (regulator of RNase III)